MKKNMIYKWILIILGALFIVGIQEVFLIKLFSNVSHLGPLFFLFVLLVIAFGIFIIVLMKSYDGEFDWYSAKQLYFKHKKTLLFSSYIVYVLLTVILAYINGIDIVRYVLLASFVLFINIGIAIDLGWELGQYMYQISKKNF